MMNNNSVSSRSNVILIASPYAGHPGHHWNNAEQIALALQKESRRCEIFIHESTIRSPAPTLAAAIHRSSRTWVHISKLFPWLRQPLETLGVLIAISQASQRERETTVIHFVDATFLIFFAWEFFARRKCVYNVVGSTDSLESVPFLPNPFRWLKRHLTRWFLDANVRRGLLEFCAETKAIGRDWSTVVGEHVRVIPYPIAPISELMSKAKAREILELKQSETILLLFGTQRADKDFATVIRAAKQLSTPPVLLFVGKHLDGPTPLSLLSEFDFSNYQICDRFVSQAEAALYFAACDAVLLPYAEGYEKGSGVLLEACQHLRPVIATDTGYLSEFVQRHRTGWLFRDADPADLARCMRALIDATPEEKSLLHKAMLNTAAQHSWNRCIQDYLALYSRLQKKTDRHR